MASKKLMLTPLEPHDWKSVYTLCSQETISYWLGCAPASTHQEWKQHFANGTPQIDRLQIAARVDDELIGVAELILCQTLRLRHTAKLWFAVHTEYQKQGIGKKLLQEILQIADRWSNLVRIEIDVDSDNNTAITLLARAEFAVEVQREKQRARKPLPETEQTVLSNTLLMARIRPGFASPAFLSSPPSWPRPRFFPEKELVIRPSIEEDATSLTTLFHDNSVVWGTLQIPYAPIALWKKRLKTNHAPKRHFWTALLDDKIVGNMGLISYSHPSLSGVYSLLISVHGAYQSMGVGSRMLIAALEFSDNWLYARRVESRVHIDNERAIRLYKKLGFSIEGRIRLHSFRNGSYVDSFLMARLHHVDLQKTEIDPL